MENTSMTPVWNLFFDQTSVEQLPDADVNLKGNKVFFPYPYQMKKGMDIKYSDKGNMAWSAPSEDCELMFIVRRKDNDTYTIWKLCGEEIRVVTSASKKISSGKRDNGDGLKAVEKNHIKDWVTNGDCDGVTLEAAQKWIQMEAAK